MSDEEQERLAEELDQYIEQLRLQRPSPPRTDLTPELAPIYDMATRFHAASPPIADLRPEFSGQLFQRLLTEMRAEDKEPVPFPSHAETAGVQENQQPTRSSDADSIGKETEGGQVSSPPTVPSRDKTQFRTIFRHNQISQPSPAPSIHPESPDVKQRKRRGLSRRTIFTSGTIAATLAGAVLGAGIEHSLLSSSTPQSSVPTNLNPKIRGEVWHQVASVQQLGKDPIRFSADTITGYIISQTGNSAEPVIAFSAACTHLGCIVQWQGNTRQFPCPCHGRTFDAAGNPVYTEDSQPHYVSLPRLQTKIENDNIYVKVPKL